MREPIVISPYINDPTIGGDLLKSKAVICFALLNPV
jgi:hypothetical protein